MRRLLLSIVSASIVGLTACSDDPQKEEHGVDAVRLIDRIGDAAIDAADGVMEFEPLAVDEFTEKSRFQRAFIDRAFLAKGLKWVAQTSTPTDGLTAHRFSAPPDGPDTIDLPLFHGLFQIIPVRNEPGPYRVSLHLEHASPIHRTSFAVSELANRPSPESFADPDTLWDLAFKTQSVRHRLHPPEGGHNRFRTFETEFDPAASTRFLLIIVVALDAPIRLDRLEVTRQSRLTHVVTRSTDGSFDDPRIVHASTGTDVRESIVLPLPATLSFPTKDLPIDGWARLSLSVAPLDRTRDPEATLRVNIHAQLGPDTSVTSTHGFSAEALQWHDMEVLLESGDANSSDDEGELKISLSGEGLPDGFGVALANPVIEPVSEPNDDAIDIVLISLDTVRADRLSPYGAPLQNSPNIDQIAKQAAVFERAFSTAPWTLASHASIFTGQLPEGHGLKSVTNLTDGNVAGLAGDFREAGYQTMAVTAGGYVHADFGFAEGFEQYNNQDPVPAPDPKIHERRWDEHPSHQQLLQILKSPRRRPLFLFVHSYVAHNYDAARSELAAIGADAEGAFELRDEFAKADTAGRLEIAKGWGDDPASIQRLRELYDATIHAADQLVGDVVDTLRESGRLDRTILVIVSDHGEELFEHGRFGHGPSLAEEVIHIPLIVRGPGIEAGRITEVASTVDIAPTLRDLFGLPTGAKDGQSLAPLLRGEDMATIAAISQRQEGELSEASLRAKATKLVIGSGPGAKPPQLSQFDQSGRQHPAGTSETSLLERLETTLRRRLKTSRENAAPRRRQGLSPEREAELRELGYLGG